MERAILSTCGKGTAMEKAENYKVMSTTLRVCGSFEMRLLETLSEEEVSVIEACVIGDGVATDDGIQDKGGDGHDKLWFRDRARTGLEILVVGIESRRKTKILTVATGE